MVALESEQQLIRALELALFWPTRCTCDLCAPPSRVARRRDARLTVLKIAYKRLVGSDAYVEGSRNAAIAQYASDNVRNECTWSRTCQDAPIGAHPLFEFSPAHAAAEAATDIEKGEAAARRVYDALRSGPRWQMALPYASTLTSTTIYRV